MWQESNLFGVYLPPLIAYMAAALVIYLPLRVVLTRLGALSLVWNPPLAEVSLYVCILGGLMRLL